MCQSADPVTQLFFAEQYFHRHFPCWLDPICRATRFDDFAHVSAGQAKSGDALTRSTALFYEADVGRGTPRWFTGATRHEESGFYRRLRRIIRLVGRTRGPGPPQDSIDRRIHGER